jgi:hypothetical protein
LEVSVEVHERRQQRDGRRAVIEVGQRGSKSAQVAGVVTCKAHVHHMRRRGATVEAGQPSHDIVQLGLDAREPVHVVMLAEKAIEESLRPFRQVLARGLSVHGPEIGHQIKERLALGRGAVRLAGLELGGAPGDCGHRKSRGKQGERLASTGTESHGPTIPNGVRIRCLIFSKADGRERRQVLRVVGCLPRAEITSERHGSEGQASDKPQGTKPRAQLTSRPQAESAYGDSAGTHVPMIAA